MSAASAVSGPIVNPAPANPPPPPPPPATPIQNIARNALNNDEPSCSSRICHAISVLASPMTWLIQKVIDCVRWLFCSAGEAVARALSPNQQRLQIYRETKHAAKHGFLINDVPHQLDPAKTQAMQQGTVIVNKPAKLRVPGTHVSTDVTVYDLDTFLTARKLQKKGLNPVALNMANAVTPGGSVEQGVMAQEECLFFRSNYYQSLYPSENPHLKAQCKKGKYRVPDFGVVYTPQVQVFRKTPAGGYAFITPYSVDMIASAAFAKGHDMPKDPVRYENLTKSKMRAMLREAVHTNHDSIVLGAYGCGAFGNDPKLVSKFFKDVISEPEFNGHFREIAFGVIDDSRGTNHQIFKDTLDGMKL